VRAIYPDHASTLDRDGVEIYYELYEREGQTIFLIPPSPITHSRIYKAQIPYLARHYRVLTFDGRGSGRSGRPTGVDAHTRSENVADAIAVLDATGTRRAVLVAHCHANWWGLELAQAHPERVVGWVAIDPGLPYIGTGHQHWRDAGETWDEVLDDPQGWKLFNRHVISNEHRRWIEFFFSSQLVEPHSTKQYEDAVAWALESTGEILADSEVAQEVELPDRDEFLSTVSDLDIPVQVIHGDRDVCQHVSKGRDLADLTGGDLMEVVGGGHLVLARDPVRVNLAIKRFIDRRVVGA